MTHTQRAKHAPTTSPTNVSINHSANQLAKRIAAVVYAHLLADIDQLAATQTKRAATSAARSLAARKAARTQGGAA